MAVLMLLYIVSVALLNLMVSIIIMRCITHSLAVLAKVISAWGSGRSVSVIVTKDINNNTKMRGSRVMTY